MSSGFEILAVGERRLQALFDEFPARLDARLYAGMERIAERLLAAVRAAEPSRTGELRGETDSFIRKTDGAIVAGVIMRGRNKSDFGKDAALEYGSHREITVALRGRLSNVGMSKRFRAHQLALGEAYERRTNLPADRYLRGPFAAMQASIIGEIEAAIDAAASEK